MVKRCCGKRVWVEEIVVEWEGGETESASPTTTTATVGFIESRLHPIEYRMVWSYVSGPPRRCFRLNWRLVRKHQTGFEYH